jgi:hypothetical protein
MGEITVLFIALLGIYTMLRLRPLSDPARDDQRPAPPALAATAASANGGGNGHHGTPELVGDESATSKGR